MNLQKTFITLANGLKMPLIGFGTWQAKESELERALNVALESGYRHIDTAPVYENEHIIGNVIKKWLDSGKIKRKDLFLVTKVPPHANRPSGIRKYLDLSLTNLQVDYIDLYLVHTPFAYKEGDELHPFDEDNNILIDPNTDHIAIWKEMENQLEQGKVKGIGISNFNQKQIANIINNCTHKPINLQIELHIYCQQRALVDYCRKNNIAVTAYSPLGSKSTSEIFKAMGIDKPVPDLLSDAKVLKIAESLGKSSAQILLRHIIQRNIAAIPRSTTDLHIKKNIQVFDFELSDDLVAILEKLDEGDKGRIIDFSFFKGLDKHPEYPF